MLLTWGASRGGAGQPSFALGFANLGSGLVDTSSQGTAVTPTFTRATVAQALLGDGTFGQVSSGNARAWFSPAGVFLGYIGEGARTNLCVRSQSFGSDWSAIGTPTRSAGTTVLGTVQLDTIGDDTAAALEGYSLSVTFTGDAVKGVGILMKAGTSTSSVVRLRDTTAGADRLLAVVTWAGTVPTVTMTTGTDLTGTISAAQLNTSGVYWLKFATTSVTAANAQQLEVYPATDAALSVGATGTVEAGVVNEEDATFPSSPIITTGATVTRNADVLSYPLTGWMATNVGTMFGQFRTFGTGVTRDIAMIQQNASATERFQLRVSSAEAVQFVQVGASAASAGTISTNTTVKAVAAWSSTDANGMAVARDGGAVVNATAVANPAAPDILYIGIESGNNNPLFGPISRIAYFPNRLDNSALVAMTA